MPGFVPVGVLSRGSLPAPSGGSTLAASASLTSSATLSANARMRAILTTALNASASVNATARGRSYVTSSMSAVATMSALAQSYMRAVSSLSATATLSGTSQMRTRATSALSATATLSALARQRAALAASLSASASLAAMARQAAPVSSVLTASVSALATLRLRQRLTASLPASVTLTALARQRAALVASLQTSASLSGAAILTGVGTSLAAQLTATAIIKAYAGTASKLNGGLQNCIVSWLVTETGAKAVLFNQNAPRPALPYASILVEQVAPHQHAGKSAPSDQGTVDVSTVQEVAMQVQFFGPGSLLSAEIALDSLGKPSIQAVFEACGIAMLGTSAITNEARLVADRYEEGAGFTAKLRITDVMHDNSGLLSTVSLEGEVGGHSAAYTIN